MDKTTQKVLELMDKMPTDQVELVLKLGMYVYAGCMEYDLPVSHVTNLFPAPEGKG